MRDEHDDRLERELPRARQAAEWNERQLKQQIEDTERRYKNRIDDIENDDRRGEARIVSELTAQNERLQDRVESLSAELDSTRDKLRAIEGRHEEELRTQRSKYSELDARYKRLRSDQSAEQQNTIEMLDRMAQTDDQEARQMMMHLFAAQHGIPMPEVDPMDGATAEMFKMATALGQEFLAGARAKRDSTGSPTLGETMPYRFVEQVRNRDLCPAVDCATLEPFDVPCHKVRLTSGLVIDGEPVFAEGNHILPAIPLWDYERPQRALPDLVPVVRTDVEFAETLVTECAYAHSRAVEAGLAPRIMGIRIRFPSAFANLGHGPLEVRPPGGIVPDEGDVWAVEQVLYEYQDAETTWPIAGDATLDFHPSHNHYHLSSIYSVAINDPDDLSRPALVARKLGFRIEETTNIRSAAYRYDTADEVAQGGVLSIQSLYRRAFLGLEVESAVGDELVSHQLGVTACRVDGNEMATTQGLIPGGVDEYDQALAGQAFDPLAFRNPRSLRFSVELDPDNTIVELNEHNNFDFFDVDVSGLRLPYDRLVYDDSGGVDLWDDRTQAALSAWCRLRDSEAHDSSYEGPDHNELTSCRLPTAFEAFGDSDTCFDYADCTVEDYESGVGRCVPELGTSAWLPVSCIEVEGSYKWALEGTTCGGAVVGVCDESGEWRPCE
jgi:hypothetical protein